ncbi:hypothetical protein N2152v2_003983 [Parachlorella kessleri]
MASRRAAGLSLRLLRLLSTTEVKDDEALALVVGFWGFFSVLAGYFLLLPLRDEAGVSLGTANLPKLFAASLVLTLLATPLAAFFLNRHPVKERGLQQLYRFLALVVLVFAALYCVTGAPTAARDLGSTSSNTALDPLLTPVTAAKGSKSSGAAATGHAAAADGVISSSRRRRLQQAQQASGGRPSTGAPVPPSAAALSRPQQAVRVAFFLAVSLLNLVAVSSWWARAADVFTAEAAARLFGILGAGATLGQLVGSLVAASLAKAPLLRPTPGSPSLLPLLLSAALLATAGQCAVRFRVGSSHLPSARAAAGPTGGLAAAAPASSRSQARGGSAGPGSSWRANPDTVLVSIDGEASPTKPLAGRLSSGKGGAARGVLWRTALGSSVEGFNLIMRSAYLRHLCLFLVLNYIVSSFFYFEKSLVVATAVQDAASRTAWFAAINSASAFCILGLQLLATGPVLRRLGVPRALAVTPGAAGLLMSAVAVNPTPTSVGLAEVLRKVLTYSLARPAREVLFTVVTREEKYKAKIFVDTVVQRCGDAVAAGAFQALDGMLGFGPSGVAIAAVPVCCVWVGVALALGRRQEQLAAGAARRWQEDGLPEL